MLSYFLLMFYLTQKPFWFKIHSSVLVMQWEKFQSSLSGFFPALMSYLGDVISNVILFIPFGLIVPFFLMTSDRRRTIFRIVILSLGAILLSTALFEMIQLFNVRRYPSFVDIFTNFAGGSIGITIYLILYSHFRHHLTEAMLHLREKWELQVVLLTAMTYLAYQCFPFDIRVSRSMVMQHLRYTWEGRLSVYHLLQSMPAVILLFMIFLFVWIYLEKHPKGKPALHAGIFVLANLFFINGVYAIQSFCHLRYTSYTEWMVTHLAWLIWSGFLLMSVYRGIGKMLKKTVESGKIMALLFRVYGIFLLIASIYPFDFGQALFPKIKQFFDPFHDYQNKSQIILMMDFIKDFFKYFFLVVLWNFYLAMNGKVWTFRYSTIYLGLLFLLEFLQLFHKIFTPDFSDIIIGISALIIGRMVFSLLEDQWWSEKK